MQIRPQKLCCQQALTLVEVLFGVALAATLAFLLMPSLNDFLARSHSTSCTAKMKAMHRAIMLYVGDHNGNLPPYREFWKNEKGEDERGDFWSAKIKPYLSPDKAYDKQLRCPAEKELLSNHYGLTSTISSDRDNPERLNATKLPAQRFMMGDANQTSRITTVGFKDPKATGGEARFRHAGDRINLLFFDGHVESRTYEEIPVPKNKFPKQNEAFFQGTQ